MKKRIVIAIVTLLTVVSLTACNRQMIDTTYSYNYAYIYLQNGDVIEGEISSWRDYDNSDQLQIKMKVSGDVYLVHSCNCTLIKRK